ncbi:MAG: hypothetical protein ACYSWQ_02320 [Planctomycetota bacterium]|jgi:hypothetical protein
MSFGRRMSDPGHKKATCPKCYSRRTLFDGRMGHYCMFCGHKFEIEEVPTVPQHEFQQTHSGEGPATSSVHGALTGQLGGPGGILWCNREEAELTFRVSDGQISE